MWEHKSATENYSKLKNVDIREIDPATVTDTGDVTVDAALSPAGRKLDVVRQMKGNPFVYRCGDVLVKNLSSPVGTGGVPEEALRRPLCGTIQL